MFVVLCFKCYYVEWSNNIPWFYTLKNYNNKPSETWYWCEHVHVRLTLKVNVQRHAKTNESYTHFLSACTLIIFIDRFVILGN